jgi:hypothetical protein
VLDEIGDITEFRSTWYTHHTGRPVQKRQYSLTYVGPVWNGALQELDRAFEKPVEDNTDFAVNICLFVMAFLFGIRHYQHTNLITDPNDGCSVNRSNWCLLWCICMFMHEHIR